MKLFLYYIGKPRDRHLNTAAGEFMERISRYTSAEMREVREDRAGELWQRHPSARRICLDPAGRAMDSQEFASLLSRAEMEGRDLVFLVGGADGLAPDLRKRAELLLSLSAMTFPHELARVMLAEQIYRGLAILRGHPYPR